MELSIQDSGSCMSHVFTRQPDNPSVIVAAGHDVHVSVSKGHLLVSDGLGKTRRSRRVSRVDGRSNVARLVILSDDGYVSFSAIRWCADLGISIMHLDSDGRTLMSSPGLAGDARLRIAQVKAMDSPTGTAIVRMLINEKLIRQASVLHDVFKDDEPFGKILDYARSISKSSDLKSILAYEGQAAALYWRAWRGKVSTPFRPSELPMIPAHWYTFGNRASLRNPLGQGKNATDPVNAMLNYAYAICESEARYACRIVGLDPAIGYGHGHRISSDTLAFDLMEVLRPVADRVVLSMMDTSNGIPYGPDGRPAYLQRLWFCESGEGVCSLIDPLTHMLSERVPPAVAKLAGQWAEKISRQLSDIAEHRLRTPSYAHRASPARLQVVRLTVPAIDLAPSDLLSDQAWDAAQLVIPPEPTAPRFKQPRFDDRAVLAGILLHELHGVSWRNVPASFGMRGETSRRRLLEWKELGVWPAILAAVRPHLSQ